MGKGAETTERSPGRHMGQSTDSWDRPIPSPALSWHSQEGNVLERRTALPPLTTELGARASFLTAPPQIISNTGSAFSRPTVELQWEPAKEAST